MLINDSNLLEKIIFKEISSIMLENGNQSNVINHSDMLNANLGFSSLDLARLIAILEMRLNIDLTLELISVSQIKTVKDLVKAYMTALKLA